MFKWRSPVEINRHVRKSAFWREHSGNRLNWRQAPIARLSCLCCLKILGRCDSMNRERSPRRPQWQLYLHQRRLPVGRAADRHIQWCSHNIYCGNRTHAWHRCFRYLLHHSFLVPLLRQELPRRSVDLPITVCQPSVQSAGLPASYADRIRNAIFRSQLACRVCSEPTLSGYSNGCRIELTSLGASNGVDNQEAD